MTFLSLKPVPISVVVRSKQKLLFEGEARVVTSTNQRGAFDILPYHTNFVSLVGEYIEITTFDRRRLKMAVERGLLRVRENQVEIFVL